MSPDNLKIKQEFLPGDILDKHYSREITEWKKEIEAALNQGNTPIMIQSSKTLDFQIFNRRLDRLTFQSILKKTNTQEE